MISLILCSLVSVAWALPAPNTDPAQRSVCTNPKVRREWRSLSIDDRKKYIKSVECMLANPAAEKKLFPYVTNRYEDFVALHANATGGGVPLNEFENPSLTALSPNGIHSTGVFLPWHRYFITIWEEVIQKECGWDQALPYWDWSLDSPEAGGAWIKSPLFDNESGFGGNGEDTRSPALAEAINEGKSIPFWLIGNLFSSPTSMIETMMGGTGGGCVQSGAFKNMKLHLGPQSKMDPKNVRCLRRNFNPKKGSQINRSVIRELMHTKTFGNLRRVIELPYAVSGGAPFHDVGHQGVGGEMGDLFTSTNDPLFYVHHAGLDRLWAMWQEVDTHSRLYDVSPAIDLAMPDVGLGVPVHIDTPLWMGFGAPDRLVKDVMDTLNRDGKGFLCYTYDKMSEMYT